MRILLKALRPFKEALDDGELVLDRPEGETLAELIRSLAGERPSFAKEVLEADGTITHALSIMVGGRPVTEDGMNEPLEDGDEVLLFMPLSGG